MEEDTGKRRVECEEKELVMDGEDFQGGRRNCNSLMLRRMLVKKSVKIDSFKAAIARKRIIGATTEQTGSRTEQTGSRTISRRMLSSNVELRSNYEAQRNSEVSDFGEVANHRHLANRKPLVIGLSVGGCILFLVIVAIGVYIWRLYRNGNLQQPPPNPLPVPVPVPPIPGIAQSIMDNILDFERLPGLELPFGIDQCSICLQTLEVGEMLLALPSCDHIFHSRCIREVLQRYTQCPLCQQVVELA